jgi:hypothetical protein
MPIFVGRACKVDADGNPDYDLKPMIGAYTVTVIKYMALMFLHGGVVAICVAVFKMTPETANTDGRFLKGGRTFLVAVTVMLFMFFLALLASSAKVVGLAVKWTLESCDRKWLGVDLTIKHAALSILRGYVNVEGLVFHQPDEELVYEKNAQGRNVPKPTGKQLSWKGDFVAKVHTIIIKIDMWTLITSGGTEFVLTYLNISGLQANIEKPDAHLSNHNSNWDFITNHVSAIRAHKKKRLRFKPLAHPGAKKQEESSTGSSSRDLEEDPAADPGPQVGKTIVIHKITVGDVAIDVSVDQVQVIGHLGFHVKLPLLKFEDIQREVFDNREDLDGGETVACIVKAIAKRVLEAVMVDMPLQIGAKVGTTVKKSCVGLKHLGALSASMCGK